MTFYVGQKVVCIEDDPDAFISRREIRENRNMDGLALGGVYTVKRVGHDWLIKSRRVLWLNEITRPLECNGEETGYASARFRPLVERKTSIEIFTRMLTPNKRGVDA